MDEVVITNININQWNDFFYNALKFEYNSSLFIPIRYPQPVTTFSTITGKRSQVKYGDGLYVCGVTLLPTSW